MSGGFCNSAVHASMPVVSKQQFSWLVVSLLLFTSALTLVQVETVTRSYGQYVTQTNYTTGMPTSWHMHTGSRTWTNVGNRTFTWLGNVTWGHMGNHTWAWTHTGNQTWTWPGNMTTHRKPGIPGLAGGWAHWNMTIGAKNLTQPILMNGTQRVRLGFIAINTSSTGQMISNVAFNDSVFQIEFDRNGSIQLTVNSSAKPLQVYADDTLLPEAQSLIGLPPQSNVWVYDANNQSLTVFADPSSVTVIYAPTSAPVTTPVPEYPSALYLVLIGCLVMTMLFAKNSRTRTRPASKLQLRQ
jgi:ABC-type branched-subunit amino acid transport system permease subunit